MKDLRKMVLIVVQLWMSGALLLAMVISAIIAAPFMLIGKIMDHLDRGKYPVKGKLPGVYTQSKLGYLNF